MLEGFHATDAYASDTDDCEGLHYASQRRQGPVSDVRDMRGVYGSVVVMRAPKGLKAPALA